MKFKKLLACILAASVMVTSAQMPVWAAAVQDTDASVTAGESQGQETVTYKGVTFYRASDAAVFSEENNGTTVKYTGMPLFNGKTEDLNTYVDLVMEEIGLEGWISILASQAPTGKYTDSKGQESTYTFPISIGRAADVGLDGETQWPNQLAQAQTWNLDLMKEAGSAYGDEIRSKNDTTTIKGTAAISAHVAQIDARPNPLSGRYDEGFGEDAFLIGEMANAWSDGMTGDDSDLYMKSIAQTKHWTTYNSEFFRLQGGNNVSARTFYEYYAKAAETPFENGNITGYMSSYGNMNNVPATSTFIHDFAQNHSRFGLTTGCDFMSEYGYLEEQYHMNSSAFSNGYDEHYSTSILDRTASMILAGHKQGGTTGIAGADIKKTITDAVENGVEGLTEEDIYKVARPTVVTIVRTGAVDERNEDGTPRYYPYSNVKGVSHASTSSQETERKMAEESIVLLKNEDHALPLQKDQTAGVYGVMSTTFQYGQYSSEMDLTDAAYGEGAGDSILEAIERKNGKDKVIYNSGNRIVAYKGANGYLTASTEEDGAQLTTTTPETEEAVKTDTKYQFEYADWGQDAFSLLSLANNKWLSVGLREHAIAGTTPGLLRSEIMNDDAPSMKAGSGATIAVSNLPQFLSKQSAGDNSYYLKFGAKYNNTDFSTTWALSDRLGWYVQDVDGQIAVNAEGQPIADDDMEGKFNPTAIRGNLTPGVDSFQADADKAKYTFEETTISESGAASAEIVQNTDYAIVVVGQPYNGISGEGIDRMYLNLSQDQMDMVSAVADNYAKAGKKTIVIINTEYPVEAKALQDNKNVSAIIFNPHGGQYKGEALANILYGDAAPTGRLVSTWYNDESALPTIDNYSMPNKAMTNIGGTELRDLTLDDLDDSVTVDMTEADLQQAEFSYMYADPQDVTYEFGYGLSYSDFTYSDLTAAEEGDTVKVNVTVTNNGTVATSDVVQIYASNPGSEYKDGAADKKLVGFQKVNVAAGASQPVNITVDKSALEVWDVNAGAYTVEPGQWQFYAAHSCALDKENVLNVAVNVTGEALKTADTNEPINVWSHAFDSDGVKYVEISKGQTAKAAAADSDEMFSVMSKKADAWIAMPKINLDGTNKAIVKVASVNDGNVIELHQDSPSGALIGTASFGKTEAVTQKREVTSGQIDAGSYTELGYTDVDVALENVSGTHDVYVVFKNADTRIATVSFAGEAAKPDQVTVTFNKNGGEALSVKSVTVEKGSAIGELQSCVRKGYLFDGWYTEKKGGTKVTNETICDNDLTLYAHWTKVTVKKPASVSLKAGKKKLTVTFKKAAKADGYQIRYADNAKMNSAKKTTSAKTSKVIKKLKAKTTYYVQVRAYRKDSTGAKVYGKWTKKVNMATK